MLSEELNNVAAHLRAATYLPPVRLAFLADILEDLAAQAAAYEDTEIVVRRPTRAVVVPITQGRRA